MRKIGVFILVVGALFSFWGHAQHFSLFRLLVWLYLLICAGAALLAIVVGPGEKPLERLGKRFSSFVHLDGRIEIAAFLVMLSFPLFQLSLIVIAWHGNWSEWMSRPDLANVMSFWAITVAAAIGTSAAEYKEGTLTQNLSAHDALELAKRLEAMLKTASRKATVTTIYLAIGISTQVIYWLGTVQFVSHPK